MKHGMRSNRVESAGRRAVSDGGAAERQTGFKTCWTFQLGSRRRTTGLYRLKENLKNLSRGETNVCHPETTGPSSRTTLRQTSAEKLIKYKITQRDCRKLTSEAEARFGSLPSEWWATQSCRTWRHSEMLPAWKTFQLQSDPTAAGWTTISCQQNQNHSEPSGSWSGSEQQNKIKCQIESSSLKRNQLLQRTEIDWAMCRQFDTTFSAWYVYTFQNIRA